MGAELFRQNGCREVIALSDYGAFSRLEKYRIPDDRKELSGIAELRSVLLERHKTSYARVYVAYIAAKLCPEGFEGHRMVQLLAGRFSTVRGMEEQGRGNVVGALLQTSPPLIEKLYGKVYKWNENIDAHAAVIEMAEIIRSKYRLEIPDAEAIDAVRIKS